MPSNIRRVGKDVRCENARPTPPRMVSAMTVTPDLTSSLPEMERAAADHEAKARALRQIIAGIRALNGYAEGITEPRFVEQNGTIFVAQAHDPNGPRGRAAVLRVMRERPGYTWRVIELKREILGRGWAPSPKAVEANLKRIRQAGEVISPRYGYYKLAPADPEPEAAGRTNVQRQDGDAQ